MNNIKKNNDYLISLNNNDLPIKKYQFQSERFLKKNYQRINFTANLIVEEKKIKVTIKVDSNFNIVSYSCDSIKPLGFHYRYIMALCLDVREHLIIKEQAKDIEGTAKKTSDNTLALISKNFDRDLLELNNKVSEYNNSIYTKIKDKLQNNSYDDTMINDISEHFACDFNKYNNIHLMLLDFLSSANDHQAVVFLIKLFNHVESLLSIYEQSIPQLIESMFSITEAIKTLCSKNHFDNENTAFDSIFHELKKVSAEDEELFLDLIMAIKPLITDRASRNKVLRLLEKKLNLLDNISYDYSNFYYKRTNDLYQ